VKVTKSKAHSHNPESQNDIAWVVIFEEKTRWVGQREEICPNLPLVHAPLLFRFPPHSRRAPCIRALRLVPSPPPSIVSRRVPRSGDMVPVDVSPLLCLSRLLRGVTALPRWCLQSHFYPQGLLLPSAGVFSEVSFVVASAIRVELVFAISLPK
jgi:hypothetical protein